MDLKQKLLDNVAAEAEAKRQAIEANAVRIAQTDDLCNRLNAANTGAGFTPVITVCSPSVRAGVTPKVVCTARTHVLCLEHTHQAIVAANLRAISTVQTYPEEPQAPWKHERSIAVDGFPGIDVKCTLNEKEQQAALCA